MFFVLLLLCAVAYLPGQEDSTAWREAWQVDGPYEWLSTDALGNTYTVNAAGQIALVDPFGKIRFRYLNSTLGALTSLDVSDPFNILLFYRGQQMLVLLDRTLNERSRLDLRTTALVEVSAVATSHDNAIWVFDHYQARLKKINAQGNILLESDDWQLALGLDQPATTILRLGQQVLVYCPDFGVARCDLNAQWLDWLPYSPLNGAFTRAQELIIEQADAYYSINPSSAAQTWLASWPVGQFACLRPLPNGDLVGLRRTDGRLCRLELGEK